MYIAEKMKGEMTTVNGCLKVTSCDYWLAPKLFLESLQ